MSENQAKISQKERLKEITDSIETGIKDMFESDKYRTYLQTMSRFHKYSLNNTMLIAMQKPDATLVAGFNKWKDGFGRNVKKGEKGIKIIAPVPYKVKEEQQKLDPVTNAPLLDKDGKVQLEEVERQIPTFRVVSVFDVSQTEGKEIPSLVNDLVGNVEHFDAFMEALKRTSPVPIDIKPTHDGSDGYYHLEDKTITIREGMSEIQTISATVHEIAHSKLHDKAVLDDKGESVKKDRNTEEVEAESISYAVCNYYGIETADNSLGYIANWSKGKELKELKSSLELIGKTSSELITSIDKHFAEIVKERGIDLTKEVEPVLSYLEILATKIDSFARDYDPHGYRDNVENSETHIAEIMENLRIGKIAEMREYLTDIGDLDGNDTKQAFDLIVELDEFADSTYPQELAYKIDDNYISIFVVDDGYDYSMLDKDYNLLDGGQLDNPNLTIYEALHEVSESEGNFPFELADGIEKVNFTELTEKADEVEIEKIKAIKFDKNIVQANDYHPDDKPIVDLTDIKREVTTEYDFEQMLFLQNYLDTVVLKYDVTETQVSDFVIEGVTDDYFNILDLEKIDKKYFAE
ncbi:MAG: LPD16 domain-containing protein, partial [Phocaeicola sp.]